MAVFFGLYGGVGEKEERLESPDLSKRGKRIADLERRFRELEE